MATGKDHERVKTVIFFTNTIAAGYLTTISAIDITSFVAFTLGSLTAYIVDPDLDLETTTNCEYRFGWLFSFMITHRGIRSKVQDFFIRLYRTYWSFYALTIPHRSFWSHMPVIGTIIRILYMFAPFILFSGFNFEEFMHFVLEYINVVLFFTLALSIQDLGHFALDGFKFKKGKWLS